MFKINAQTTNNPPKPAVPYEKTHSFHITFSVKPKTNNNSNNPTSLFPPQTTCRALRVEARTHRACCASSPAKAPSPYKQTWWTYGCGSNKGIQNSLLVKGKIDQNHPKPVVPKGFTLFDPWPYLNLWGVFKCGKELVDRKNCTKEWKELVKPKHLSETQP